jgi:hypothetical protein
MRTALLLILLGGLVAADTPSAIPSDAPVLLTASDVPRLAERFLATPMGRLREKPWALHAVAKLMANLTEAGDHLPVHRVLASMQTLSVGVDLDRQGLPIMIAEASLTDHAALETLLGKTADRLQVQPGQSPRWIAQQFSAERRPESWVLALGENALGYQPTDHPRALKATSETDVSVRIDIQNALGTRAMVGPLRDQPPPVGAPIITGTVSLTPSGLFEHWMLPTGAPAVIDRGITRDDLVGYPRDTLSVLLIRSAGADLATALERTGFMKTPAGELVDQQLTATGLPPLPLFLRGITGDTVLVIGEGVPLPTITISVQLEPRLAALLATRLATTFELAATPDPAVFAGKLNPIMPLQISHRQGRLLLTTLAGGAVQWDERQPGFLDRPEIAAQLPMLRFAGTSIVSLSRSSDVWGLLAALTGTQIQQAGIPNAADIPRDLQALGIGGFFEACQTPSGLEVKARGLVGGPLGLYTLIGAGGGYVTLRDTFIIMANRKIVRDHPSVAKPPAATAP